MTEIKNFDSSLISRCGFYCGSCPTYLKGDCSGCRTASASSAYQRPCVMLL